MLAADALVCPRCGNLTSVCSDPDVDWHPQETVCWASATRDWGLRRLQAQHKDFDYDATDERGELLMSPLDGMAVWVSDVDLDALRAAGDTGDEQEKPADQ